MKIKLNEEKKKKEAIKSEPILFCCSLLTF